MEGAHFLDFFFNDTAPTEIYTLSLHDALPILQAHAALARGDSSAALQLWDGATRRYAVLSAPLELVASLWPLRLELVRVAVARGDSTAVARGCASFDALMGYADQVAQPQVEELCRATPAR